MDSESDSDSEEEASFLQKFGGVESKPLFEEDEEAVKRRERAIQQQKSVQKRSWGSNQHALRWAKGNTLDNSYVLENGSNIRYIETPGQQLCLWDCAILLAKFLESRKSIVQGKAVIELGCGVGLPGLVASRLGAREVHLTDKSVAVPNLQEEIRLNNSQELAECKLTAASLEWGKKGAKQYMQSALPTSAKSNHSFDVVLCSDLIYAGDTSTTESLVDTIDEITAPQKGGCSKVCEVVSCHEIRFQKSTLQEEIFVNKLNDIGFRKIESVQGNNMPVENVDASLKILLFRRSNCVEQNS
mmetsp:Transcript_16189/g.21276  ORF Transcript_16189/g.21276 Transcript_16189/m.21276 type:complete len:300 (-) Transcript_16189:1122-2021(-)